MKWKGTGGKQQKIRHWLMVDLIITVCLLACIILPGSSMIKGKAAGDHQTFKYYTSIRINQGDSLWTIAVAHMGEEYDNIQSYIDEVKEINQLKSDHIHAGQYLMLPYYSNEVR